MLSISPCRGALTGTAHTHTDSSHERTHISTIAYSRSFFLTRVLSLSLCKAALKRRAHAHTLSLLRTHTLAHFLKSRSLFFALCSLSALARWH